MNILISNPYGTTTFTSVASFDAFRNLVATGQKIQAIKHMREKEVGWGLKEAKEFVDYVSFPPEPATESKEDNVFLREVKADLRDILVSGSDYLFGRVCEKVGLSR